jgi:hypothetical protein
MEIPRNTSPFQVPAKPKLVFLSYKYDERLPDFLLIHHREHIRCISETFDVIVIDYPCDYQQICDQHQPDLTLFETGLNILSCQRPAIKNLKANPQVPRLGFINADAWCETRTGTISDIEEWRLDALFSISVTASEHAPEIADRLFVLPNFVDPQVYRDYGESKIIPILLTGAKGPQYPWRRRVYKLVAEYYPSMSCPHGGYLARSGAGQVMYGERYARTINASFMAPTCGTIAKEVVRKHFEIPGCRACLITEKSPGLEAAGFVDMANCVFADEKDILEKVAYLFQRPEKLRSIADAGHQLVQSRHTLRQRHQILQWLNLHRHVGSNQRIVQPNPFEPLRIVERSLGTAAPYVVSHGLHLDLMRQGDDKLRAGEYRDAEALYLQCLSYMNRLPEAKLRLALCSLYLGKARQALSWVFEPIQYSLDEYKATDPDPVEWAYYIISLLCLGKLSEATERAGEFAGLVHPELGRTRWMVNLLKGKVQPFPVAQKFEGGYRPSIHRLPCQDADEWLDQLAAMFKASRQTCWSDRLNKYRSSSRVTLLQQGRNPTESVREGNTGKLASTKSQKGASASFRNRLLLYKARRRVRSIVSSARRKSEAKWAEFIPHAVSKKRNNNLFRAIREVTRDEEIKTALVAGLRVAKVGIEALVAEDDRIRTVPSIFCVSRSEHLSKESCTAESAGPRIKWYAIAKSSDPENPAEGIGDVVRKIKRENGITQFDVVLIDNSDPLDQAAVRGDLEAEMGAAKVVILNDIVSPIGYGKYLGLLESSDYALVEHNPDSGRGYAIFRRRDEVPGRGDDIALCAVSN